MKRADIADLAASLDVTECEVITSFLLNGLLSIKEVEKMYGSEPAQFWQKFFLITRQDKINKLDELNAYILAKYFSDPNLGIEDWAYIFVETLLQAKGGIRGINMFSSKLNALADEVWKKIESTASFDQKISLIIKYPGTQLETKLAEDLVIGAKSDTKKLARLLNANTGSSVLGFKAMKRIGELLAK